MQASELFPGSGGRIGANELRPAWKVGQEFIESLSEGTDELWRADIANTGHFGMAPLQLARKRR